MSECHGSCHKAPQVSTCYMTVPGDLFNLTYLLVFGPVVTREKLKTALLIHMGIHVCVIAAQNPLYLQGLIQHVLQQFLPCPISKGNLQVASKVHHKAALVHSTHPLIRSCASSTWPACPRRSTMLHFSRNTTKLTSWIQKELQAFLWIPGLHGYKLAHACDHLKKTQFGSLYSLATFAQKTSFHGLLTFLPSHAIPPKPCIPSRHMAIKPRCRCRQLLFSHTQAPCA